MVALATGALSVPGYAAGAFPGHNGRIAFFSQYTTDYSCSPPPPDLSQGEEGIFAMNPDGSGSSTLTEEAVPIVCNEPASGRDDSEPTFGPDGRRVAFTRSIIEYNGGGSHIFLMHADGTHQRRVPHTFDGRDPAFSPNGTRIAFSTLTDIFLIRPDGTRRRVVVAGAGCAPKCIVFAQPTFFPSGKRIVYVHQRGANPFGPGNIYTIRTDGTHRHQLTFDGQSALPDISPNGKQIVFTHLGSGAAAEVELMRTDGTHKRVLGEGAQAVFSPSGKRIAFALATQSGLPSSVIAVMRTDGSHEHSILPSPPPFSAAPSSYRTFDYGQPDWGPGP